MYSVLPRKASILTASTLFCDGIVAEEGDEKNLARLESLAGHIRSNNDSA
ncbi:MAG: hypothetical protein Tsb0017_18700 [Geothermobacteraceae bacterium]